MNNLICYDCDYSLVNEKQLVIRMPFRLKNLTTEPISVSDPKKGDCYANSPGSPGKWSSENIGRIVVAHPTDQHIVLNYTSKPGNTSGPFYALCFQLRRLGFTIEKADEKVEVSPMHQAYYQLTHKQKEELEGRIKQGLASAAQSIADFELAKHDERKYKEFLHYFGYKNKESSDEVDLNMPEEERKKKIDNHSIRAVFIDLVDVHTGNDSMRTIVQRWPTLITDFMTLSDEDIDPEKIKNKLKISKAEGVVLATKNKLFNEWKSMFGPEIKTRYQRIRELIKSREESIKQYREWVKPHIARHRLLKEALSESSERMARSSLFLTMGGHAVSMVESTFWAWKDFEAPNFLKRSGESVVDIPPYDNWTKKHLIWDEKNGLVSDFKWITKEWVDEQVYGPEGTKESPKPGGILVDWMWKHRLYYAFVVLKFAKSNIRFADGSELEDVLYFINTNLLSQNALLAKLLEIKAKQYEMERYVNSLLGVESDDLKSLKGKPEVIKDTLLDKIRDNKYFTFFRKGPYENTFEDKITRGSLIPLGRQVFIPIVSLLKDRMGIGKVG